jgi:hypothetical protein
MEIKVGHKVRMIESGKIGTVTECSWQRDGEGNLAITFEDGTVENYPIINEILYDGAWHFGPALYSEFTDEFEFVS